MTINNTEPLKKCPYPTTKNGSVVFPGAVELLPTLRPEFCTVAAPLNQLLKKGGDKTLPAPTDEQRQGFTLLRDAFVNAPILKMPDPNKEYSKDTDACDHQIGAALLQEYDGSVHLPIRFW